MSEHITSEPFIEIHAASKLSKPIDNISKLSNTDLNNHLWGLSQILEEDLLTLDQDVLAEQLLLFINNIA